MKLLITNGTIVTHSNTIQADILCENDKIIAVGSIDSSNADEIIDAHNLFVFPGGIDPHVHMNLALQGTVSSDDFESGSMAGLAGGTTTIIDYIGPERQQSLVDAVYLRQQEAEKSVIDYSFHMSLTWFDESIKHEIKKCIYKLGITSFKAFLAYKETVGLNDEQLLLALETIGKYGGLLSVHAENGEAISYLQNKYISENKITPKYHALSRPSIIEGEATYRALALAEITNQPIYIAHMTCEESVNALKQALNKNQKAYGETCPQYLLLNEEVYQKPDFEAAAYVISPPIRQKKHNEVLWNAIKDGTIKVIGTDHCPFRQDDQKSLGKKDFTKIPNGAAGIEHRLSLLYTYGVCENRININELVSIFSTNAAKIYGLYPKKGTIQPGSDADIVLFDPSANDIISSYSHHHNCDRSIYEGFKTKGKPVIVITKGNISYDNGKFNLDKRTASFIKRKPKDMMYNV